MAYASTKLVAINSVVDTVDVDSRPGVANVSSDNKKGHRAVQATKGEALTNTDLGRFVNNI